MALIVIVTPLFKIPKVMDTKIKAKINISGANELKSIIKVFLWIYWHQSCQKEVLDKHPVKLLKRLNK